MSLRRSRPLHFSPKGCSDALDSTNVFSGAMANLKNLIPEPTTQNLWQCRPAAVQLPNFSNNITSPGFISCLKLFGDYAFGLIASGLNPGNDQPFVYDIRHQQWVPVTGITAANTPASQASSGAWTPPTCDMVGKYVVFTSPGFDGVTHFFGWIDFTDPSTPVWSAGNTAGTSGGGPLPGVPIAVAQFFGRAYYLVNPPFGQPAAIASDILDPLNITNAFGVQTLTFGDRVPLIAAGGLPLSNQLGGIIQSLIIFKASGFDNPINMFQITGDFASTSQPISVNAMNVATSTIAPNSIIHAPTGLMFLSADGFRQIDFDGRTSKPLGEAGSGINVPFLYALTPSRVCAASNADVIRVSTTNNYIPTVPNQEWWYDLTREVWSGPHTFPASLIQAYGDTFIMAPLGVTGSLWQSDIVQSQFSTFVENGTQMTYSWQTSLLPDTDQMSENAMVETTINMATGATDAVVNIAAFDEGNFAYDQVQITPFASGSLWNNFNWNNGQWAGGVTSALYPRQAPWHWPIVFRRLSISVTGNCTNTLKFGDMFLRYEELGYLQQLQTSALGPAPGIYATADNAVWTADTTIVTADRAP